MLFDDWADRRRMLALGIDGYIAETLRQDPATPAENIERMRQNDLNALRAVQFDRPDLTAEVPKIKSDLLIYAGDADPKYDLFKRTSELIATSRFLTIPGADHGGGFDQTGVVLNELIRFLSAG
jgi:pimeloyl-ACP methyl ester carboxylesterase